MLKFYDRENEIALLLNTEQKSLETAQMTFVVGRRRIGKTDAIFLYRKIRNNGLWRDTLFQRGFRLFDGTFAE